MTGSDLILAKLVYDGGDVAIPADLGTPRDDQMQGTPAEQLIELAGRACYDSLGKGRASFTVDGKQGYHDHITQVGHGSVWEHFNFTIDIKLPSKDKRALNNLRRVFCMACMNRPGVITLHSGRGLRVTLNARAVNEWLTWEQALYGKVFPLAKQVAAVFSRLGNSLAPHVMPQYIHAPAADEYQFSELNSAKIVKPVGDYEKWVSMFLTGSRGLSHELVRHGDFTAISQRSTRYVDESESEWVEHPLITQYVNDCHAEDTAIPATSEEVFKAAKEAYRVTSAELESYLADNRGVDKLTARKQARGAARGYLGNALYTELIFSANVAQWKRMLRQRASVHADAEIRELFCKVLAELKLSRYAESFENWQLERSPDGIGYVAIETVHELVAV